MHRLKAVKQLVNTLQSLPDDEEITNFIIFLAHYSTAHFPPKDEIVDYIEICIDNYINYVDIDGDDKLC